MSKTDSLYNKNVILNQEQIELLDRLLDYHITQLRAFAQDINHKCLINYHIKKAEELRKTITQESQS